LSEYDLELVNKPGKSMYVANTRSRNYKSGRQTEPLEIGFNIAGIEEYVATPQGQCEHNAKATESDMNSVC